MQVCKKTEAQEPPVFAYLHTDAIHLLHRVEELDIADIPFADISKVGTSPSVMVPTSYSNPTVTQKIIGRNHQ
jgi:hypothetical protein